MNRFALPAHLRLAALLAAVALTAVGCAPTPSPTPTSVAADAPAVLASHGLGGLSAREIVDRLDAQPVAERPADLRASVRPDELVVSDASGAQAALPMPDDAFYLAIAPYLDQTHECFFHSLTTCRGELSNTELAVTVTDARNGSIVFDDTVRTFDNGFAGLWLPKGLEGVLTVTVDGRSASAEVSTAGAEDATCLTTLHLV